MDRVQNEQRPLPPSHRLGREAEHKAATYLAQLGWTLLHRNYRIRGGEVDIIARDGKALVFVEVRARDPRAMVNPEFSVDARKRGRISLVAKVFLHKEKDGRSARAWANEIRFDVITYSDGRLLHFRSAFFT